MKCISVVFNQSSANIKTVETVLEMSPIWYVGHEHMFET